MHLAGRRRRLYDHGEMTYHAIHSVICTRRVATRLEIRSPITVVHAYMVTMFALT